MTQTSQGRKFDEDKLRYDLVPVLAQEEVVKVITLGAKKYDPENWKNVPEGRRRYYAAAMRHMEAWRKGEKQDEIGTHHIANAISNLMFILEKELQGIEDVTEENSKVSEVVTDNITPSKQGWIVWNGIGITPAYETVDIKFRDGDIFYNERVDKWSWEWHDGSCGSEIIAYRVVK